MRVSGSIGLFLCGALTFVCNFYGLGPSIDSIGVFEETTGTRGWCDRQSEHFMDSADQ